MLTPGAHSARSTSLDWGWNRGGTLTGTAIALKRGSKIVGGGGPGTNTSMQFSVEHLLAQRSARVEMAHPSRLFKMSDIERPRLSITTGASNEKKEAIDEDRLEASWYCTSSQLASFVCLHRLTDFIGRQQVAWRTGRGLRRSKPGSTQYKQLMHNNPEQV